MTKSITGRQLTEKELAARRKGVAAAVAVTRKPPELKQSVKTTLTPGEWAIIQQLRAQAGR